MALLTGGQDRRDAQGRPILGKYTGSAFPFGPTEDATLGPKPDLNVVVTSIAVILSTEKGSVVYDPEAGSVVPLLMFEPLDEVTLGLIRYFTLKDLSDQEPRAVFHAAFTEREGDSVVRVSPSFSLVGDPRSEVHNAPLTFRREAAL